MGWIELLSCNPVDESRLWYDHRPHDEAEYPGYTIHIMQLRIRCIGIREQRSDDDTPSLEITQQVTGMRGAGERKGEVRSPC